MLTLERSAGGLSIRDAKLRKVVSGSAIGDVDEVASLQALFAGGCPADVISTPPVSGGGFDPDVFVGSILSTGVTGGGGEVAVAVAALVEILGLNWNAHI